MNDKLINPNLIVEPIHRPAMYRKVPLAEIENGHTFRSIRYFPELRQSVSQIRELQTSLGRDMKEHIPEFCHFRRKVKKKYTHHLDELKKSALTEINALAQFRQVISEERIKERNLNASNCCMVPYPSATDRPLMSKEEHLASANAKLTKFAVAYDSRSFINILAGFQGHNDSGGWINKQEFDTQLRRCLNIVITRDELDALFDAIDDNHNGLIEGVEFTRHFFKLGNAARQSVKLQNEAIRQKQLAKAELKAHREQERIKVWEQEQARKWEESSAKQGSQDSGSYETLEFLGVMERLAMLTVEANASADCAMVMRGFENYLTPNELKLQIERSFGLKLTGAEMGAILNKYSTLDGEHCIDGRLFSKDLLLLGQKVKHRVTKERHDISDTRRLKYVWSRNQPVDCLPKSLGR